MDQDFYYSTNFQIKNISESDIDQIINQLFEETKNINKDNNNHNTKIYNLEQKNKIMTEHISKLHHLVFKYIQQNGVNLDLILQLKKEINRYQLEK